MGNENYTRLSNNAYDNIIKPNLDLISAWIRDGHSVPWIANKLGITDRCLQKWKARVPEFKALWDVNKEKTDLVDVVGAYLKSAKGYFVTEYTREYRFDEDGNRRLVCEYEKTRYIQPDTKVAENWIKHRLKKYEGWEDFAENISKKDVAPDTNEDNSGIIIIPERSILVDVDTQYSADNTEASKD